MKPAVHRPDPKSEYVTPERCPLNKLDERHRTIVVLRYFHELPIAEIAEVMEINEGTIHSRLHTARERL